MLKILPIILFFYAHGSAYYSSMSAYYSNLLPILLQRVIIKMTHKHLRIVLNHKRAICSLLKTACIFKLKRKLPQPDLGYESHYARHIIYFAFFAKIVYLFCSKKCSFLFGTYFAQNSASKIHQCLLLSLLF